MQQVRCVVVAAAVLALAVSAQAVPTLMIQTATTNVTLAANNPGNSNNAPGTVEFIGTLGVWTISLTGVESGSGEYPTLDLSSDLSSTAASWIDLSFADIGFGSTPSFTTWNADVNGTLGGNTNSTLGYSKYYSTANTLFSETSLLYQKGFIGSAGTDSFGGSGSGRCRYQARTR